MKNTRTVALVNLILVPPSVAQFDARPTGDQKVAGWEHSFVKIDHEIFCTVILFLPLVQEEQLSVSGERMCTILVNRLENSLPSKNVAR